MIFILLLNYNPRLDYKPKTTLKPFCPILHDTCYRARGGGRHEFMTVNDDEYDERPPPIYKVCFVVYGGYQF